jgi:CO/xanthine dehydrogenase FAD-binding subunit
MRSDPADYALVTPETLETALNLLAEKSGGWRPVAGGTDVMVQFAAGHLASRKFVSIWNLPELRHIEILPGEIRIGAASTYTDLRKHDVIAREFPLIARAASWTGGIANQNRGTLGGNIANASPAADSLPSLLVYDADLVLISARGERRLAYRDFHTGYKQMNLAADELIRAICLPRKYDGYVSYARKVGARNAQAISKVCIAALGRVERDAPHHVIGVVVGPIINDVRIALGSVAPVPIRLVETERVLSGEPLDAAKIAEARNTAVAETRSIDDIRSTARYRAAVVSNLVGEFLERLAPAADAP